MVVVVVMLVTLLDYEDKMNNSSKSALHGTY